MGAFTGFVKGTRYTSVPNAVLGPLLAEIDSLAELKCTLRILGMIHQRRGARPWITLEELLADRILLDGLANEEGEAQEAVCRGVTRAVARGTLLEVRDRGKEAAHIRLLVNDEQGRRAAKATTTGMEMVSAVEPADSEAHTESRLNIFTLYEDYFGTLTPLLAEELKEAEATYSWRWIRDAFREAESLNHRSWRYISRILERWSEEGKEHGESGGYSKTAGAQEHLRRYGPLGRR